MRISLNKGFGKTPDTKYNLRKHTPECNGTLAGYGKAYIFMKYYLAPMEGLTTYNFRTNWNRCYGGMDKYFTPFISNRHMNSRERNDVLPEHNVGMYTVPQILTNKVEDFLSLAEQLAGYGYHEVNLNLGCPSGTVVARNRGAGFLGTPRELEDFLDEIFEKCPLEISIKTRIGMDYMDEWAPLLKIYQKFPMKELIIHPRLQRKVTRGHPIWKLSQRRWKPCNVRCAITGILPLRSR